MMTVRGVQTMFGKSRFIGPGGNAPVSSHCVRKVQYSTAGSFCREESCASSVGKKSESSVTALWNGFRRLLEIKEFLTVERWAASKEFVCGPKTSVEC